MMKCDKCENGLYYDAADNAYVCRYCNGTGETPANQCTGCDGIGKVRRVDPMDNSYYRAPCLICGGTGVTEQTVGGTTYETATGFPIAMHVAPIEDKPRHYTIELLDSATRIYTTTGYTGVRAGNLWRFVRSGFESVTLDHADVVERVGKGVIDLQVYEPRVDPEGRLIRAAGDVMRAQRIKGIAKYKSTLEDQNGYTVGGMIDMVAEELADGSVYVQKVREQYLALLDELEKAVDTISPRVGVENVQKIINREKNRVP